MEVYGTPVSAGAIIAAGGAIITGSVLGSNIAIFNSAGTGIADGGFSPVSVAQAIDFTANGAASVPALKASGSVFTGGSTTTNKPLVLFEETGAVSTGWSSAGAVFGLNRATSVGFLFDFQVNGQNHLYYQGSGNDCGIGFNASGYNLNVRGAGAYVKALGMFGWSSSTSAIGTVDTLFGRRGAGNIRLGNVDAAAPQAQIISVQNVVSGTANSAGAAFTINGSVGTGSGAGGSIIFQTAAASSAGSVQNALAAALTIDSTKLLTATGGLVVFSGTAIGAGAVTQYFARGSSNSAFAAYYGSGAPSFAAAIGSPYFRSDGSSTVTRAYICLNSAGAASAWAGVTTAA